MVKKLIRFAVLLCLLLFLCSCGASSECSCDCSCAALLSEYLATATSQNEEVTTVLWNGERAMIEDVELYGEEIAREFYTWRHVGNPDIYGKQAYMSGHSVYATPLQEKISLSDPQARLGVRLVGMDEGAENRLFMWSHFLNIDKFENASWERLAILEPERVGSVNELQALTIQKYSTETQSDLLGWPLFAINHDKYSKMIEAEPVLTVDMETIFPKLTAGTYRFVLYVVLYDEAADLTEYIKVKIPFEVVE